MVEERLRKLREDLKREFERECNYYVERIKNAKDVLLKKIDNIIEVLSTIPINVLDYDIVEVKNIYADRGATTVYIDIPEGGKYKIIILGKKITGKGD